VSCAVENIVKLWSQYAGSYMSLRHGALATLLAPLLLGLLTSAKLRLAVSLCLEFTDNLRQWFVSVLFRVAWTMLLPA